MHYYNNLLYVNHGLDKDKSGLKQALSLAYNNDARLTVLVIGVPFPKEYSDHQKYYEESTIRQTQKFIENVKAEMSIKDKVLNVSTEIIMSERPAVDILKFASKNDHDLIIKSIENTDKKSGFKALDMNLLRKSPVEVWLCRPINNRHEKIKVAVAIDPERQEESTEDLSHKMLKVSMFFANACSKKLHVISCWDYVYESYLNQNEWLKVSEADLSATVASVKDAHLSKLESLIENAKIDSSQTHIHHIRGNPEDKIPEVVQENDIDILVMGTVGRTGIKGFIFGNTAENIMQNLTCSLVAFKPKE